MNTQKLKNLQEKLLEIISSMIIEDDEKEISDMQDQALKIISNEDFREHINGGINGYTILDTINKCSERVSQNYTEKKGLAKIEKAVKDAGGKTSQKLGRNANSFSIRPEDATRVQQMIIGGMLLENVTIEPVMRNNRLHS